MPDTPLMPPKNRPTRDPLREPVPRPVFSAGQNLNATDLNAIGRWTDGRLRLMKERLGWGVVRGLRVHIDPVVPAGVVVSPGYAVLPDGADLTVPLPIHAAAVGPPTAAGGCARIETIPSSTRDPIVWQLPGGNEVPVNESLVFDVVLTGQSVGVDPRRIPADPLGARMTTAPRTNTRRRLVGRIELQLTQDEPPDPSSAWATRHNAWSADLLSLLTPYQDANWDPQALAFQTLRERHGRHELAFEGAALGPPRLNLARHVFETAAAVADVTDRRRHFWGLALLVALDERSRLYEAAGQVDEGGDNGVRLARAYCDREVTGLRVLFVREAPPYRREFKPEDPFPAPSGSWNLARVFGQEFGPEAAAVSRAVEEITDPAFPKLRDAILSLPFAHPQTDGSSPGTWTSMKDPVIKGQPAAGPPRLVGFVRAGSGSGS